MASGVESTATDGTPPEGSATHTSTPASRKLQRSATKTQQGKTSNKIGDGQGHLPKTTRAPRKFDSRKIFKSSTSEPSWVDISAETMLVDQDKPADRFKSFPRREEQEKFYPLPVPFRFYLPHSNPRGLQYFVEYARNFEDGLKALENNRSIHQFGNGGPDPIEMAETQWSAELFIRKWRALKSPTGSRVKGAIKSALPFAPEWVHDLMAQDGTKLFEKYMAATLGGHVQPDFTMLELIILATWQVGPVAKGKVLERALRERFPFFRGGGPRFRPLQQKQFQCPESRSSMPKNLYEHMSDVLSANFDCHGRLFDIVNPGVSPRPSSDVMDLPIEARVGYHGHVFNTFGFLMGDTPYAGLEKLPAELSLPIYDEAFRDLNDKTLATHTTYMWHIPQSDRVLHYEEDSAPTRYWGRRSVFLKKLDDLLWVPDSCSGLVEVVRESFFRSTTFLLDTEHSLPWLRSLGPSLQKLMWSVEVLVRLHSFDYKQLIAVIDILAISQKLQYLRLVLDDCGKSEAKTKQGLVDFYNGEAATKFGQLRGLKTVAIEVRLNGYSLAQLEDDEDKPFLEQEKNSLIARMKAPKMG